MGAVSFQLLDNEIFTPADIVDGRIYTSPTQNNLTGTTYPALKLIADYQDLQGTFGQVGVTAFVEAESEQGHWYPIAYQFNQFGAIGVQHFREIVLQPDLFWFDVGIDNIIWVEGKGAIAQASNQQGFLFSKWRAAIGINDPNNTFQSLQMSLYGERYGA